MLALAAVAVSSSYYEDDVIGPIADLLQRQRGFGQSQLGMLNGVISIPNVALALINGLLIDRYGPARVAFWSAAISLQRDEPLDRLNIAAVHKELARQGARFR